jgi:hypothetical protein
VTDDHGSRSRMGRAVRPSSKASFRRLAQLGHDRGTSIGQCVVGQSRLDQPRVDRGPKGAPKFVDVERLNERECETVANLDRQGRPFRVRRAAAVRVGYTTERRRCRRLLICPPAEHALRGRRVPDGLSSEGQALVTYLPSRNVFTGIRAE